MSETAIFSDADIVSRMAAQREDGAPDENAEDIADADEAPEQELEAEGADAEPEPDEDPAHADGDHEETDEEAGEESHALDAPDTWPADRIETWNSLPVDAQEAWLAREEDVQRFKSKTGRETAEAKAKAAEAESTLKSEYQDRIKKLDEVLPTAIQNFKSKYEAIDWVALAKGDPDQYNVMRAEAETEQQQLQTAAAEAQQANAKAVAEQQKKAYDDLLARNPHYTGEAGQKLLAEEAKEVEAFALSLEGVTPDQLKMISAPVFETLRDAMKFRKAQKTATKPAKKPAQKAAKPGPRKSTADVSKKIQSDAKAKLKALANSGAGRAAQEHALAEAIAAQRRTN